MRTGSLIVSAIIIISSSAAAFETTPEDGETGFPVDGNIIIEFDTPMDTYTVDVNISPDMTYPVQRTWSSNDTVLILNPTVDLLPNRVYTIHLIGDDIVGHNVSETFSFETGANPSQDDNGELISWTIIPIFIAIAIVAVIAFYFVFTGNRKKKG